MGQGAMAPGRIGVGDVRVCPERVGAAPECGPLDRRLRLDGVGGRRSRRPDASDPSPDPPGAIGSPGGLGGSGVGSSAGRGFALAATHRGGGSPGCRGAGQQPVSGRALSQRAVPDLPEPPPADPHPAAGKCRPGDLAGGFNRFMDRRPDQRSRGGRGHGRRGGPHRRGAAGGGRSACQRHPLGERQCRLRPDGEDRQRVSQTAPGSLWRIHPRPLGVQVGGEPPCGPAQPRHAAGRWAGPVGPGVRTVRFGDLVRGILRPLRQGERPGRSRGADPRHQPGELPLLGGVRPGSSGSPACEPRNWACP